MGLLSNRFSCLADFALYPGPEMDSLWTYSDFGGYRRRQGSHLAKDIS